MNVADRYGPWAVVAGASEGVGRAIARELARRGVPCVLLARRTAPLDALMREIHDETGVTCAAAAVDLAAPDALARIVGAVGTRQVGLFVANAGADPYGSHFLDREAADWQALVQRNVMTTMSACHHFGAAMRARRKGGLLLVNSGACYGGASFMATYAASKAFMLNFSEALWAELQPFGVDVLTLVLGQTDTPAFRRLLADKGAPVPASLASPDDVARVGLERLPHGPIHNWGLADDAAGYAPQSASARRERVRTIDRMTQPLFGLKRDPR